MRERLPGSEEGGARARGRQVVRLTILPDGVFNRTPGREEVKRLTGSSMVPVLVTDDGEVIRDSMRIVEWAQRNAAGAAAATS